MPSDQQPMSQAPSSDHAPISPARAQSGRDGRADGAGPQVRPLRERKPPWLKVPAPGGARYRSLERLIESEDLQHRLP